METSRAFGWEMRMDIFGRKHRRLQRALLEFASVLDRCAGNIEWDVVAQDIRQIAAGRLSAEEIRASVQRALHDEEQPEGPIAVRIGGRGVP